MRAWRVETLTSSGVIRGAAAGNFGVVTQFEYHLHPIGPEVMFAFILYSVEDGLEVLRGLARLLRSGPGRSEFVGDLRDCACS